MAHRRSVLRSLLLAAVPPLLAGCASLRGDDPLQVTVAGIEPLPGEGLELRMLVKLRVLNPNDAAFDYDGVYVKLDVLDRTFATGAGGERGQIPRFGESVVAVPVTVSVLRMVGHTLGVLDGKPVGKIGYKMSGKLNGPLFGAARFQSEGELDLSAGRAAPAGPLGP